MAELKAGWPEQRKEKRRCFRRNAAKDQASWKSGGGKGNRSRWALRNLPPIEDDLGSILLTLEGE